MNFKDTDFEIKKYIHDLDILNNYLEFALETTILRQIPNVSLKDEKLYAKEILCNYYKGDMHAFTSAYNIRNNIYTIGNERLTDLFLKYMIIKQAYNVLIKKIDVSNKYSDQCCRYITNRIARKHYSDILEWLNNDMDNIEEIIINYTTIFYKRNSEECKDLELLAEQTEETSNALKNLNVEVNV